MDKWKEQELAKMKSGGNSSAKEWLEEQADWSQGGNLQSKYNSKAAALYKDKVGAAGFLFSWFLIQILVEAQGGTWSEETSSAKNHKSSYLAASSSRAPASSSSSSSSSGGMRASQSYHGEAGGGGYQGGAADQTGAFHMTKEFKAQKEDFFGKKQAENASRREDLAPSQGGKYAGFGSSSNNTVQKSYSTQDFGSSSLGGLTSSLSTLGLSASGLGSRVAEVGWKFTSLAGQKAAELSENVTEKVSGRRRMVRHVKTPFSFTSLLLFCTLYN